MKTWLRILEIIKFRIHFSKDRPLGSRMNLNINLDGRELMRANVKRKADGNQLKRNHSQLSASATCLMKRWVWLKLRCSSASIELMICRNDWSCKTTNSRMILTFDLQVLSPFTMLRLVGVSIHVIKGSKTNTLKSVNDWSPRYFCWTQAMCLHQTTSRQKSTRRFSSQIHQVTRYTSTILAKL